MDNIGNVVDFNNLDYGAYILTQEGSFTEAFKFAAVEFDRIYTSQIRLPDGRDNIIYLLSDTFEKSVDLIGNGNFFVYPSYRKVFYPILKYGFFFKRQYRLNLVKEKSDRDKFIKNQTKGKRIPYPTRYIPESSTDNLFFITADLYNKVTPFLNPLPIQKLIENFYREFLDIINPMSPSKKEYDNKESGNRILIIDTEAFKFSMNGSLSENKLNPLFILYLAFLRTRDFSTLNVDMDMLIVSKNLFLKFNPARMSPAKFPRFRTALFRIMNANLDDYTSQLKQDEQEQLNATSEDYITRNIVDKTVDVYTKYNSPAVRGILASSIDSELQSDAQRSMGREALIKASQKEIATGNEVKSSDDFDKLNYSKDYKVSKAIVNDFTPTSLRDPKSTIGKDPKESRRKSLFDTVVGDDYKPLSTEADEGDTIDLNDYEEEITDDVDDIIRNNKSVAEDVVDEIQERTVPLKSKKNSPINTARDEKLREEQKKIIVRDSTIEEILSMESSAIPIQTEDKSGSLKSLNPNIKNISFSNFDKTYIEELYNRDIIAIFNSLQDKSTPFYITSIDVQDSSTALDLKETWTIHLKDESNKSHRIVVDIPKFYQNKFMWLGGNKKMILKQNLFNPIVKDTPNSVIITSYKKITITRRATKSFSQIERLFTLIKKTNDDKMFIAGDASKVNIKYISTLEYDELGRSLFKFKSGRCELFFNRDYIKNNLTIPKDIKGDEFLIGYEGDKPVLINENTGKDHLNRTIMEIIYQNLPNDYRDIFDSIKSRKQAMYAEGKLLGQFIPVVVTLIVWIGISKTLDAAGFKWEFHHDMKKTPPQDFSKGYIRFADGVLEYESNLFSQLLMNGLLKLNPDKLKFESLNSEEGYIEYLHSIFGNYTITTQFKTFYEFLLDPITKDVCRDIKLPSTPEGLLIHAVKLLADNGYVNKASDKSYRVRSVEIIPAILYNKIADQYTRYINSGRRIPFSIKKGDVIKELLAVNTVEDYSTLNPAIEIGKSYTILPKGYNGSNLDRSYDEEKRSYDPSSIGKLAMSSSPDANIGIARELVVEPTITNARGYRGPVEDVDELKDVNIFSPVELLTPGTARNDDPIRTAIAGKQTRHLVPVANASPSLVSNGFDEAIQYHLSSDFVVNAEEDGEVVEVNGDTGFIMVKYKSGKTQAINTNPEVVKNGGGGFFVSNTLKATVKLGDKFHKDDILAYHDKYFRYSKNNGLRYAIGPLVKCAFMSTYNTYEDAGICTEKLADMLKTAITYKETGTFKRNSNILHMVKVGDHVNIGDSLIRYDTSFDDAEISKLMAHLSDENKSLIEETSRNDVVTQHAGVIVDIKVYSIHDPSNLSSSLGGIVKEYFDRGNAKKEFLSKYDPSEGILKSGYLLTDNTEPTVSRYGDIKGVKTDVLIEFYIEHGDVAGIGDKIVLYGPNKQIISEVIPKGFEPYSELHPEEEISVFTSPGTVARRMVTSVIPISMGMKCMIELKRKIKGMVKY